MRKTLSTTVFLTALFILISRQSALAQSDAPKLEVGVQYSLLRLEAQQPLNNPVFSLVIHDYVTNDSGIGGRLTYNLTDHLSMEGELNFFPEGMRNFSEPIYLNSRRLQGLFGVKAGTRGDRMGVFGKVRPGFMRFGTGTPDPQIQTFAAIPAKVSSTEFALDLGGVFELYPSRHTMVRFDLGDTLIRYGKGQVSGRPSFVTHNLQMSAGFGFRF